MKDKTNKLRPACMKLVNCRKCKQIKTTGDICNGCGAGNTTFKAELVKPVYRVLGAYRG